jgi:hypothetical protein
MAFPENIYDIYNKQLELDAPFVTACIAAIKAEISNRVTNQSESRFQQDLQPLIGELEAGQQNRIKDQVIYQLRMLGIRAYLIYVQVASGTTNNYIYSANFNSTFITNSNILMIEWNTRNDREFMKAYV